LLLPPPPRNSKTMLARPLNDPSDEMLTALPADDGPPPEPRRKKRRRARGGHWRCPYCGTDEPPVRRTKTSTGGWVVFVVLLVFFFPLCFLGFLITDEYRTCIECGSNLP